MRSHRTAAEALNNLIPADQTNRLWVQELRELPDPSAPLRGQAELAGARFDRGPMTRLTQPESDEPLVLDPSKDYQRIP